MQYFLKIRINPNKTHDEQNIKILNEDGIRLVLLSSPFVSGSSKAWHGVEYYNLPGSLECPVLETPVTPCCQPQHLFKQPHDLSTPHVHFPIRFPALSHFTTATTMFSAPGATVSIPSLYLCKAYHPSRSNSVPTFL